MIDYSIKNVTNLVYWFQNSKIKIKLKIKSVKWEFFISRTVCTLLTLFLIPEYYCTFFEMTLLNFWFSFEEAIWKLPSEYIKFKLKSYIIFETFALDFSNLENI